MTMQARHRTAQAHRRHSDAEKWRLPHAPWRGRGRHTRRPAANGGRGVARGPL